MFHWTKIQSSYPIATWTNRSPRRGPSDSHTLAAPTNTKTRRSRLLHTIKFHHRPRRKPARKAKMAQAIASMAGLQAAAALKEGSRLPATSFKAGPFTVRAQNSRQAESSSAAATRRSLLGLVAAGATLGAVANNRALAEAKSIKVTGAPPPSGGKPGTLNADEARDLDLPLKERFFIQPLPPVEAMARAKESAKEIMNVKQLIDRKAWPYVQNDLRLRASYLRYDLNTVISAKPKEEKKPLKALTAKLFDTLDSLDYAARQKSSPMAEKYYAEAVSALNEVLAKLG